MTHKTKGIVLRTIKYGETSLVVTMLTELFGVQTYMVNGVRTSKKSSGKAVYFQPAAILDMIVYHNDQKTMHRIKEYKWDKLYENIFSDIIKNNVALYLVELIHKCLKQPEANPDLFYFCEDVLNELDKASNTVTANIPLFFALHLPHFFGFKIHDNHDEENCILDLQEGLFTDTIIAEHACMVGDDALIASQVLKAMQPYELEDFKLQGSHRSKLLLFFHQYYALHIQDFGQMKTLKVLHEVLGA